MKKMTKKFLTLAMAAVMAASVLAGCGSGSGSGSGDASKTETSGSAESGDTIRVSMISFQQLAQLVSRNIIK